MKRHLLGILVAVLVFASVMFVYHHSAYYIGAIEAHLDLLQGKYMVKAYGRLAAEKDKYDSVFDEYGIELVAVGGCTVTEGLREHVRGYNGVSVTAIDEKFGKSFWQRLQQKLGPPSPDQELEKDRAFARQCGLQNQ